MRKKLIQTIEVFECDDYNLLHLGDYNRCGSIDCLYQSGVTDTMINQFKSRVAKLKKSILSEGYDIYQPIMVWKNPDTNKLEILDGQGRYQACKELSIPFYYIVNTNITTSEMASKYVYSINNDRKSWSQVDNVLVKANSDVDVNNKEANRKLLDLVSKLGCSISTARLIYYGSDSLSNSKNNYTNLPIRPNFDTKIRVYKKTIELRPVGFKSTAFLRVVIGEMCENPNFTTMVEDRYYKWLKKFDGVPSTSANGNRKLLNDAINNKDFVIDLRNKNK